MQTKIENWIQYSFPIHLFLVLLSSTYVLGNIFAFKGTMFYSLQVGVSDKLYNLIYYLGWVYLFGFLYILFKLKNTFLNKNKKYIFFLIAINFLILFPVYGILLDKLETISYLSLLKEGFIRGISFPIFSIVLILSISYFTKNSKINFSNPRIFLIGFSILILNAIVQEESFPKLEDEFAYYYQSLVFESGHLINQIQKPENLSWERMHEITQLPYIFFQEGRTFSAHSHGWPFLLALFSYIGLKKFAGLLVFVSSFVFFVLISDSIFSQNSKGKIISISLFLGSPLLFSLANTYMSHIPVMFFLLLIIYSIRKLEISKLEYSNIIFYLLLTIGIFGSIWIRPQSAFPTIFSTLLYLAYKIYTERKWKIISILLHILLATSLTYLSLKTYAIYFGQETVFFTSGFMNQFFPVGCQGIGFSENIGCFPTYGTLGHSFRKFFFNTIDLVSTLNIEHSILFFPMIPIFLFLSPIGWNRIRKGKIDLLLLLIFSSNLGVFCLYWHNGGESYHGRYLADSIFSFYLLLGIWGSIFIKKFINQFSNKFLSFWITFFLIGVGINLFIGIKGNYINTLHQPYPSLDKFTDHYPKNSILATANSTNDQLQEFAKSRTIVKEKNKENYQFTKAQWLSVYNLGNVNLAAVATHLDKNGFLRDKFNNVLLTEIAPEEASIFSKFNQSENCYTIQDFQTFHLRKDKKKILTFWESSFGEFRECRINSKKSDNL